jgi:hypothetical protein
VPLHQDSATDKDEEEKEDRQLMLQNHHEPETPVSDAPSYIGKLDV